MSTFTAHKRSTATVPHPRTAVWGVLCEPDLVARMTPMVSGIRATGDRWRWQLRTIPVLGRGFDLSFTEAMVFHPRERIEFRHDPTGPERAGVTGHYALADSPNGGTSLSIDLSVQVDLPFPGLVRPAVVASMQTVLAAMGVGFASAIGRQLGSAPGSPKGGAHGDR